MERIPTRRRSVSAPLPAAADNRASALYELRHSRARCLEMWAAVCRAADCTAHPIERDLLRLAAADSQALARRLDRLIIRFSRTPE